jgi:hypothetical protein
MSPVTWDGAMNLSIRPESIRRDGTHYPARVDRTGRLRAAAPLTPMLGTRQAAMPSATVETLPLLLRLSAGAFTHWKECPSYHAPGDVDDSRCHAVRGCRQVPRAAGAVTVI